MKVDKIKPAIKVGGIAQMVFNKQVIKTTPFIFLPCGKSYYLLDGCEISVEDFETQFSVYMPPIINKGPNCDGRKVWMRPE